MDGRLREAKGETDYRARLIELRDRVKQMVYDAAYAPINNWNISRERYEFQALCENIAVDPEKCHLLDELAIRNFNDRLVIYGQALKSLHAPEGECPSFEIRSAVPIQDGWQYVLEIRLPEPEIASETLPQ